MKLIATVVVLVFGIALPAAAQIGHMPAESPYRDLPYRQHFILFGGYHAAASDAAGVAPQGGPITGLRYGIRVGGPAYFMARLANVFTERTVIDPDLPAGQREIETRGTSLLLADIGVAMNLTGQKSWNGLAPVLQGGVGVAANFDGADEGGYEFGTPFAITFGGGVRWTRGGRVEVRADVTDYLYQIRYPDSYYTAPAGQDPVLPTEQPQNSWKHNLALTLGVSYHFGR